jgi:hypothetical protein
VNVHHVNDDDNVIAFHRWRDGGPGDDVVVIANVGNRAYDSYRVGMPRSGSLAAALPWPRVPARQESSPQQVASDSRSAPGCQRAHMAAGCLAR